LCTTYRKIGGSSSITTDNPEEHALVLAGISARHGYCDILASLSEKGAWSLYRECSAVIKAPGLGSFSEWEEIGSPGLTDGGCRCTAGATGRPRFGRL